MVFDRKRLMTMVPRDDEPRDPTESGVFSLISLGAVVGLAGGVLSALVGSLVTVVTLLAGTSGSDLATVGTILMVLTIPLLILGAHCLDVLERREQRSRRARLK